MEPQKPESSLRLMDPLNGREGTVFDKPAPSGPPNPPDRSIPTHLQKLVRFFEGIIADESLLLDLCVDRCVGIVEFNYKKRLVGFEEQLSAAHFVGMAAPLAVELYKQVLVSIGDRSEEYAKILDAAQKELESGRKPTPKIFTP